MATLYSVHVSCTVLLFASSSVYCACVSKPVSSLTCMAYDVQDDNAKKCLVSAWARFVSYRIVSMRGRA